MRMRFFLSFCLTAAVLALASPGGGDGGGAAFVNESEIYTNNNSGNGAVIELQGGPEDVAWIVQLSDLHFSAHHPERAVDFKDIVGPTLAMVNPSLVFITGDLTDAKSKDLLTTKQDEAEWAEYQKVMGDVIKRSGLKINNFFDLRGNHDTYGASIGGSFDFYSKYSINAQLRRTGLVNSVRVQTGTHRILFVGFDSTMSSGLRGPTNLFGHPTDQLLTEINSELSQWNTQPTKSVLKISFGHFPLSLSAPAYSGRTLKHVFLDQSLSIYLCGHLHRTFGTNLKWLHERPKHFPMKDNEVHEFWEWELGDWKKSRTMRILAIDRGCISFIDFDFRLGVKETIILPTFPLDSRFILDKSQSVDPTFYSYIRALVFSSLPMVSVVARIYDSRPGNLMLAFESPMKKIGNASRGDLYSCPWNFKAFEDPSPERFLLQIEAVDIRGRSSLTELRPFSVGGRRAMLSHNWKEFIVMGCQWDALYYPLLWSFHMFILSILLIPKAILSFSRKKYTYKNFNTNRGLASYVTWITMELYSIPRVWCCIIAYLLYLILCPLLCGQGLVDGKKLYMTYRGWALKFNSKEQFEGFPDIMVIVIPHLYVVVLPTVFVIGALVAETGIHRDNIRVLSSKKEDDYDAKNKGSISFTHGRNYSLKLVLFRVRWIRKVLLVFCLTICCIHFLSCRALSKAYEMNPFVHFPIYSMSVPLLMVYAIYRTSSTF
ncbi:putative metallophosphoesterase At3g03305 isoform X1 [Ipomoea triloba]|uniref:putative metallophosphoesterase At3g03305 isoform X1 n=2 Tax=Ipomoea triloba TaxID=35885 RepID=UPI00125E37F0|nr:putative metallophosphoesterase At3g03305 isoform X1 [Ipomoea triloba]